jgi:6-phosphogluconolactonase
MADSQTTLVYVGTYKQAEAGGKTDGIYIFDFDPSSGCLSLRQTAESRSRPSFLDLDLDRGRLFAVSEAPSTEGDANGSVSAYSLDKDTGSLELLNSQSSHGEAPCHITVDPDGNYVIVANYTSGSVASFPVGSDGRLGEASSVIQHHGSSVDKSRQEGPHAHSVTIDPDVRFAIAADLGLDKLLVYKLDAGSGGLTANNPSDVDLAPGAGPRHLDFHPNGRFVFAINELDSTLTSLSYDPELGSLRVIESKSTVPAGFSGTNYCADVHVSPSGGHVYGSNRGHDSIAVFEIDQATGRLSAVGHQPTGGETPRNFGIDPTGKYLLAANQDTNSIVTFRIDAGSGRLTPTGTSVEAHMPVCVKFASLLS